MIEYLLFWSKDCDFCKQWIFCKFLYAITAVPLGILAIVFTSRMERIESSDWWLFLMQIILFGPIVVNLLLAIFSLRSKKINFSSLSLFYFLLYILILTTVPVSFLNEEEVEISLGAFTIYFFFLVLHFYIYYKNFLLNLRQREIHFFSFLSRILYNFYRTSYIHNHQD